MQVKLRSQSVNIIILIVGLYFKPVLVQMIKEAFAWVFYQEDLENLKGDKKTPENITNVHLYLAFYICGVINPHILMSTFLLDNTAEHLCYLQISLYIQYLIFISGYIYTFPTSFVDLQVFSGVRVTGSFVLYACICFVDRCLSFCTLSFGHCVVCSSSIYGF